MEWIEVTARTLDEAKELALDRLGVIEDELEFEVLDQPKAGLFGLRRGDTRIRARVKPLSREKPSDRRRRRSARPDRERKPSAARRTNDGEAARSSSGGTSRRRRRGGAGATRSRAEAPETEENDVDVEEPVETLPVAEQADHASKFTAELMRNMGCDATVTSEIGDDEILVKIEGSSLGILVGPKGVTLQALEEVVRAAVQHHAGGHSARLHVDVGGYRERRRAALADFAKEIAQQVKDSGSAQSLEPMASPDRKLVHDTIAEIEGVVTSSEGEEPRRRVVVRPG